MTIRLKTWLITLGFMLFVLTAFGWIQHQAVSQKLDDQMREKIEAYVAQKSCEINKVLEDRCSQLDLLAKLVEKQGLEGRSGIDEWMQLMTTGEAVEAVSIVYYDMNGNLLKTSSFSNIHEAHVSKAYGAFLQRVAPQVKPAEKGQWFTSYLPGKSELALQYVRGVEFRGKGKAVMGLVFKTDGFEKVVKGMQISNRDYGVMLDDHMNFFYHPTFKQGTNLRVAYNGQFISVADYMLEHPQKGLASYPWFDQRTKTFFYQRLTNGWYVGLTVFKEDVVVATAEPKLIAEGVMVALLGATLLSLLLAGVLTRPLRDLSLILQDMGLGHYEKSVPPRYLKRRDEMGAMSGAIEKMRSSQQEHLEGLRQYQELVEDKVLEKMASLSKANEDLERSLAMMEDKNQELQGVETLCLQTQEKWHQAQNRLYQTEQVLVQGAVINSAVKYFEQEKENVLGLTDYLRREIERKAQSLKELESTEQATAEQIHHQNLLDSTDLIAQSLSAMDPIIKQLIQMGDLHVESKGIFKVREILLRATESFSDLEMWAQLEVLILCDHEETLMGDSEIFERIVNLLVEDSISERLKRPTGGHIYIKFENKGDCKKMLFSGDLTVNDDGKSETALASASKPWGTQAIPPQNLYIRAAEELLEKYFDGKLTSELSQGEGHSYHLVFKV